MRKFPAAAAAAVVLCSLCSCGADESSLSGNAETTAAAGSTTTVPATTSAQDTQTTEATTTAAAAENPVREITDRGILSEQGAIDRAKELLQLETEAHYKVEGSGELVWDDENHTMCPVYYVHVFEGERDEIVTIEKLAIAKTEPVAWTLEETGAYEIIPIGSPLVDWSRGCVENALGVVVRNPDEYHNWALEPVIECDAAEGDPYAETLLFCPITEGTTKIVLRKGALDEDAVQFIGEEYASFTLEQGKYARLRCAVPEVFPTFAIDFIKDDLTVTYIVGYDGRGEANTIAYAPPLKDLS